MTRCPRCDTDNDSEARFCKQCGEALAAAVPGTPLSAGAAGRLWMIAVLALIGLIFAGGIGYWLGASHAATPKPSPEATPSPKPADAAPAARESASGETRTPPEVKPRPSKKAAADGNGNEDDEAEAKTPASPERRLVLLKQALAECGRFNIFCKEKARWKYCADWWGKVPECPQANPGIQRQH